ncbi:MAG: type II toxin-antitoxin system RelE/ParE family toxin [Leptospiraceae bacterium]|nr:type II toxin-antitoxin system RelE/ParE family toxin [Leptospiraceae bacterium]
MAHKIIWLPQAEMDFAETLQYLMENFGQSVSIRFKDKVEKQLDIISNNPKINPIYFWKRNIRRSVVVKQIS